MDITDIYEAARRRGLTRSLRHFSRAYLGRAANYAADTGLGQCSASALLNLHRRLGEAGHADLQAEVFARLLDAEAGGARPRAVPA